MSEQDKPHRFKIVKKEEKSEDQTEEKKREKAEEAKEAVTIPLSEVLSKTKKPQ